MTKIVKWQRKTGNTPNFMDKFVLVMFMQAITVITIFGNMRLLDMLIYIKL